ncbi:MAG TPA: thiamine pyrophosphate-binding protein [Polyangiaceae bacterium]|nr:thiamine pyrophosphate-binding protein [Polyangiaceae bacterium]
MKELAFDRLPESVLRPRPSSVTAARALLETLAGHGVRVAFGIPGGAASPIFDALLDVPDITFVATRHEAMAGFAASGFARATGLPALVLTTSGPGITNAVTGMAVATLEELPVIFVAGDVASSAVARGALQDGSPAGIDALGMVRSMTRWATTLHSPDAAVPTAERAWQLATGERPGPVYIGVPLDVGSRASASPPRFVTHAVTPAAMHPLACQKVARLLRNARRPLLVLGNGARSASEEARALAERLSLPVVVTGHAKGVFPERHPLYLGIVGVGQHPSVAEYLAEPPDVVCVVGSRLGDIATNGWKLPLAGTRETIQIDRDPLLVGRNAPVTMGIVGDARRVLSDLLAALPTDVVPPPIRVSGCRSVRAELACSDSVPLKPQRVLAALSEAFPDATWCSDIGEHLSMALHYLRVERPSSFHAMTAFGSMGSGIGAAIGMKLARPDETVIALCGDGGLAMHAGEILTCVENRLGVVFAVFNDGVWNMIQQGFKAVYGRLPPSLPSRVADLAAVARGFGAEGVIIQHPRDLDPARLRQYASSTRPVILDIRIDPGESFTAESRAAAIRHFAQDS